MGAWGYKSYDNDNVADEIHQSYWDNKNPTTKQIAKTLKKIFNPNKYFCSLYEKMETRLGILVYFLDYSEDKYPVIENKYLVRAMRYAQNLKKTKGYLYGWNNPYARKNSLEREIGIIKKAQKNSF